MRVRNRPGRFLFCIGCPESLNGHTAAEYNAGGVYQELYETQFSRALVPASDEKEDEPAGDLEQLLWGMQPGDEPA